jgi:hypothetical protein
MIESPSNPVMQVLAHTRRVAEFDSDEGFQGEGVYSTAAARPQDPVEKAAKSELGRGPGRV